MSAVGKAATNSPILLVDASIYIFQYYFAMPDNWFSQKEQWPTAAVYGYTAFLGRLLAQQCPKRIGVCFDESLDQCFRNDLYADYKSSRALPDEALAFQLQACKKVTQLLGLATYASDRYEADDLLGSLYQQCQRSVGPIAILTRDKDLGQLLKRPQDFLWDYALYMKAQKAQANTDSLSVDSGRSYGVDIQQKFGVRPDQMVDYLALVGDAVDDIPGVPGIGKKTAQQLLAHFDTIVSLFDEVERVELLSIRGAKRIMASLEEYREQITISQQLATIVTNLSPISGVNDLKRGPIDNVGLKAFCAEMGFPRLYTAITR